MRKTATSAEVDPRGRPQPPFDAERARDDGTGDRLGQFPEVVATAAARLEPHDVANYLRELAADLHSFYNAHKVLEAAPETASARLALAATRQVIANGLGLLSVAAPESM